MMDVVYYGALVFVLAFPPAVVICLFRMNRKIEREIAGRRIIGRVRPF